jgi:oligopeptidase B
MTVGDVSEPPAMTALPSPPVADRRPVELTAHGHTRIDEYFWLRERDDPEVLAYLRAENTYGEALMAHTAHLREVLFEEIVGRIQQTDTSAPTRQGEYLYYTRLE